MEFCFIPTKLKIYKLLFPYTGISYVRGVKTKKVYDAVKGAKRPVSIKEIVERTDVNPNTVRGTIQRLLKQGLIKRFDRGIYEAVEKS